MRNLLIGRTIVEVTTDGTAWSDGDVILHLDDGTRVLLQATGYEAEGVCAESLSVEEFNRRAKAAMGERERDRHRRNFQPPPRPGVPLSMVDKAIREEYAAVMRDQIRDMDRQILGRFSVLDVE